MTPRWVEALRAAGVQSPAALPPASALLPGLVAGHQFAGSGNQHVDPPFPQQAIKVRREPVSMHHGVRGGAERWNLHQQVDVAAPAPVIGA